ncbi:hypothetical protein [Rhizohabitans arisaemae]|uniref:hypothetical protein n=1 Tax=Rhizohabitans arisaemae TaxID=2720610 RepID=UPI0024B1E658|nr:hypothetical protein [Rhizohabitans arisaemae]
MTTRGVHLTLTAPAEGAREEYDDWFTGPHLDEVLKVDGVVSAQRFRFVPQRDGDTPLRADLAVYELDTADIPGVHARLAALPVNSAVDPAQTVSWTYEEIAERRTDGDDRPVANPHLFVVLTAPVAGQESEFDEWYTHRHLSDVLKLTDYRSAQRFRHVPAGDGDPLRPYLALYETDSTDVRETQRRLSEVVATPAMPFTPAIDRSQSIGWYYLPVTERRTS